MTADVVRSGDPSPSLHEALLPDDDARVVVFIGHTGAGKTKLAASLKRLHPKDTSIVSFKHAIAARAMKGGKREDHETLVDVGSDWVSRDPYGLVNEVLSQYDRSPILVIDSVHHPEIREILEDTLSGARMRFVMVKTTDDKVLQAAKDSGGHVTGADEVLNNAVERPVDRELLADADLVLDGTLPLPENIKRLAILLEEMRNDNRPDSTSEEEFDNYVGGLSRRQRIDLVDRVAEEFKWMLPSQVAARLGQKRPDVEKLRASGRLFGLNVHGTVLYPEWVLTDGNELNSAIEFAWTELSDVMSDWEVLGWLMADNGYLDGERPVDQGPEGIEIAVQAELDH